MAKAARRRGGQPWPAPLQGRPPTARPAARGNWLRPRPHARGRSATAKAPHRGSCQHAQSLVGMVGACGRRQRPQPVRCRQRVAAPATGAGAHADGVQHRRLRKAATTAV
ncbi:hypothetical protein B296_00041207 [Ensete ventricosum]|uniref:Uncharacterized protein n=1 Tax=Ensete ventricosum TaxID=4639 RepID=A0A426Z849_ENSVE|nr:hypothetical protein B296_00041207 [Ensete ventricosum]